MLNGIDPRASRFLADLDRIQDRSNRAERQISSGLRVENASDDPEQIVEILRLRTRLDANAQVQTNLSRVQSRVDTAEKAMREAVAIIERARVIATQTAGTGAVNRATAAIEAGQLHDRLLALVSTSADGQFVFGGEANPQYIADSGEPNGVLFVGVSATDTTLVADENQTTFSASKTAAELFDAAGNDNAFQALTDLRTALINDDGDDVAAAMPKITAVLDHLNRQLAFYGNTQNRLVSAYDSARKNAIALQNGLTNLQGADLPAAILELNSATVHREAALSAHGRVSKLSLFDYLG